MSSSTPSRAPAVVWFRKDLRLDDNPALRSAAESGRPVVPLFVWAPDEEGKWVSGAASRWWLHHSLSSLAADLDARGSRLTIRNGPALSAIREVASQTGALSVCWNRRYEPDSIKRDGEIKNALRDAGIEAESFNSALLFEPWTVKTKAGAPYRVFTPYWRNCQALGEPDKPLGAPGRIEAPGEWPESLSPGQLGLLPRTGWAAAIAAAWTPGEAAALQRLNAFRAAGLSVYSDGRDRPALPGTSRLSPYLHWGELSPRRVWHAVREAAAEAALERRPDAQKAAEAFLRQLGWREFAHHLLYHFPETTGQPLRPEFSNFPWRSDAEKLRAWQRGCTGYPFVDAGMRELWATGWMHNRVRMAVASFLVKDLLISWQAGAEWFWDTLVDADLANNTLGWQWTAGCGADAAPFFRIFNPVRQGGKFDPDGDYVRRWVPELAKLPARWIHQPWAAPAAVLRSANVTLGESYPRPIVDHAEARIEALSAFASLRQA